MTLAVQIRVKPIMGLLSRGYRGSVLRGKAAPGPPQPPLDDADERGLVTASPGQYFLGLPPWLPPLRPSGLGLRRGTPPAFRRKPIKILGISCTVYTRSRFHPRPESPAGLSSDTAGKSRVCSPGYTWASPPFSYDLWLSPRYLGFLTRQAKSQKNFRDSISHRIKQLYSSAYVQEGLFAFSSPAVASHGML